MDDSNAPPTTHSTKDIAQAFGYQFPNILRTISGQIVPSEQAILRGERATAPAYQQLQNQLYDLYGRDLNRIGNEIASNNAMAQSNSDVARVTGPGAQLASAYRDQLATAEPDYAASRAKVSGALSSYLNSELSGGEREEISRSLGGRNAAEGSLGTPSAQSTVENAMTFGSALRDRLGKALEVSGSVLPSLRSGFDPIQSTLGRPSQNNTGESRFLGVDGNAGEQAFNTANQFLGGITNLKQQEVDVNANKRDALDRGNQTVSAVGDLV